MFFCSHGLRVNGSVSIAVLSAVRCRPSAGGGCLTGVQFTSVVPLVVPREEGEALRPVCMPRSAKVQGCG